MAIDSPVLAVLIGLVACLYASVGHGGASGYLALLALTVGSTKAFQPFVLVLNLVVASIAFIAFRHAGQFSWRLTWPFLLAAAPFAFIGSSLTLTGKAYSVLVGLVVLVAGIRLLIDLAKVPADTSDPKIGAGLGVGAGIGLLSGLVGVGGGIFLSPILVLAKWADAKKAAATSSVFIVSNSAIGLAVRASKGVTFSSGWTMALVCGALGALLGAWLGAQKVPTTALRRVLGAVLVVASIKLLF